MNLSPVKLLRALLVGALLAASCVAHAAASFNTASAITQGAAGTVSVTVTASAGDTILVFVLGGTGAGSRAVTDSRSQSYSNGLTGTPMSDTSDTYQSDVFYCKNAAAGSTIITFSDGNSVNPVIHAVLISGAHATSPIGVTSFLSNNALANPTNGITTGTAGSAVVAWIVDGRPADTITLSGTGGTWSTDTAQTGVIGVAVMQGHVLAPSTGAYTPTWSGVAATRTNMLATVEVKPSAGGAPPFNGMMFSASTGASSRKSAVMRP